MQPPECKSCGYRHWQIEGCGPAEAPVVEQRHIEWKDGSPQVDLQVYEDLKAYEATQAQQQASGYMQAPVNERPIGFGGEHFPPLPGEAEAAERAAYDIIKNGGAQTNYVSAPTAPALGDILDVLPVKPLTGLAAALVQDERMYGTSLVEQTEDGPKRLSPASVPLGFPLGGSSKDGVALTSTAHPLGPPPYAKEGAHLLAIRNGLKLSQPKFSAQFGVPVGTLRGWESGRHKMPPYFMTLLRVIEREPKAVFRALGRKE